MATKHQDIGPYQLPWENQLNQIRRDRSQARSSTCFCCVPVSSSNTINGQTKDNVSIKPTQAQLESWRTDFKNVMKDDKGRQLFSRYLKEEYSEENLEFWLEVEAFKRMTEDAANLNGKATCIYTTFVKQMSEREVNISGKTRKQIGVAIQEENVKNDTFSDAQSQVYSLMHRQSYPRFILSNLFK